MRRRYFVPEVVQTSGMDCGPACLKALFGGFGVQLSYGRLREACQTDVDGTSIDTVEDIARQLGMSIEQAMLPKDFVLLARTGCLPAIVVVNLPDGATHFVVLWRIHGAWVQVMDPTIGRVWMPQDRFLQSLYLHEHAVPTAAWEEWSRSEQFRAGIEQRMGELGAPLQFWPDSAQQDAALRLAGVLRAAGQLKDAAQVHELLALCAENPAQIPDEYWAIRTVADSGRVILRGAVLLIADGAGAPVLPEVLPSSLARVLSESVPSLWAPVWAALRAGGWQIPVVTAAALSAAAAGTVLEALLLRGLFDMGRHLGSTAARLSAVGAVLSFLAVLLMLDWPASASLLRLGRMLELRLRLRFLVKIPRLSDRYFQSRLLSDMALRAHSLRLLRQLPGNVGHCLQLLASVIVTAVAIAWIYPGTALLVGLSVAAACVVPVLFLPLVTERDLRYRELGATLTSLQLDCLLGARAIQAHSAQHTLRAVQDELLRRWRVAGLKRQAMYVQAETAMMALGFALVVVLVYRQAAIVASPAGLLLLIYWASSIPLLGQDIATAARTLPAIRNTLLRFLEPLGSPEEDTGPVSAPASTGGVKITLNDVSVILAGHAVLERITLTVQPGEHVGIVGASGAGKSSLVGCLLGWYPPASGTICVDDAPLDSRRLAQLRRETVWIDPQVHLFHKTLFENLRYGNDCDSGSQIAEAVDTSGLAQTLRYLADGLQTDIGEAGMRLSGGEGQRVRAVRGLGRSGVRLAVLDEPARGLGRDHRRRLLASARRRLAGATLLCITHDLADTLDFDRVVVIEQGRIREQGKPRDLCATTASRFRELLEQEAAVGRELWAHPMWRRVKLHAGALRESKAPRM